MKTKKSFLWLAFLILATIWILVRHNQQVGYYSVKGLVFGTVYKITYQHDGDLKPQIEAELNASTNLYLHSMTVLLSVASTAMKSW